LKFEKTILDDHQAQIVVDVDSQRLEAARHRAARKLASRGKIPGFRPGKAPYDVIVRHYGDAAIYEQAVDLLVDELYPEILKEADVNPAAAGSLEKIEGTDVPRLTFKVPLTPEVELGAYRDIRLAYDFQAPGAEALDKGLEDLRHAYASTETVDRSIQEGDYILADLTSDKPSLTRQGFAVLVRPEEQSDEFPFPGFTRHLLGLKAGDTVRVEHTFAADHADAVLAGQAAEMTATVKAVRSVNLPALDDDFAKTVGKYESLDALKEALAKEIEARARADFEDAYFTRLVDRVREGAELKYAPQTLEHEAGHVVDDMRQRLAQQGLELETYYKMRNTDAAKFLDEEARPVARKRLERALILDEVARQEKIEVDSSSLDQEFNSTLADLQTQGVNLNSIRGGKQGQQRVAEALAMQSANRLLTRRTLERLKAIAAGESPAVPESGEAGKPGATLSGSKKGAAHEGSAPRKPARKSPGGTASRKAGAGAKPQPAYKKKAGKK
jgi:trigger factor